VPHWLTEFSDSDLAALVCPRPLQVSPAGRCVSWWPWVAEEAGERKRIMPARAG